MKGSDPTEAVRQTEQVPSDPAAALPQRSPAPTTRGTLRVYLGAAPGVGKTYAMLEEGNRRLSRGADVVIGLVETHGRAHTRDAMGKLEVIARRHIRYRDRDFEEMDTDAILSRHPDVVLVDELAHSNVPGSPNAKRWEDIEILLAAGIDVLSTLNIQHLESVNDVVEKVTGIPQRETVPDAVVRQAEQIQLVDQTPEALRRRMAHGNIYAAEKVDAALSNYFRAGNLTALRELALLWVADRVEEGLQRYRSDHDIVESWETRERVVVALSGRAEDAALIRRAARIAVRTGGAALSSVHIAGSDGLLGADPTALTSQRALTESLGGSYHVVRGDDPATSLVEFARAMNATQLVLGASRRPQLRARLIGPGVGARLVRICGDIDVHIVPHDKPGASPRFAGLAWLNSLRPSTRRTLTGSTLAALLLALSTLLLSGERSRLNLISDVLIFLLVTLAISTYAGVIVAVVSAVVASALLNYYFTPPLHRFTISERNNALALAVFVIVAVLVAVLVDRAERRRREAVRASAEANTLAAVAGSVIRGESALADLLGQLREIFGMRSVALLERVDGQWRRARSVGLEPPQTPEEADVFVTADETTALAMAGPVLRADDQRVLRAFAIQAAAALRTERLADEAEQTEPLRELDRTRAALLTAVSHDLRTPLAGAKAAVSSLRDPGVTFSEDDRRELLAAADESLDRLSRLVANLLDMSRLQAGAMAVHSVPVEVEDVIALALDSVGPAADQVGITNPPTLPPVKADPGLLERVLGNLLENALRIASGPITIAASARADLVELRVIDHGPGLPVQARESAFAPFQRFGDSTNIQGVGLGLALARGFTEAMGGTLVPEETPGGGLTMVVTLEAAIRDPLPLAPPHLAEGQRS
ncbi:osmosensitive K+ channel signal transduction histidine kinase [Frankineae bacterium MT45]|nr:osmosensitive K+ channel signal transduction histidine kinase [Frankineae bacterium MT45]